MQQGLLTADHAVQQRNTAIPPANTDRIRPSQTHDLHQRPASTSMQLTIFNSGRQGPAGVGMCSNKCSNCTDRLDRR